MERPLPQSPAIAASEASRLARFADAQGLPLDPLLGRFGIRREDLLDPDGWVPLPAFLALREAAAEAWGDPHLGLHMAERASLADHGTLGFVLRNAPMVRRALEDLMRYIHVVKQQVEISLREQDPDCLLSYRLLDRTLPDTRQDSESSLALGVSMLRELVGPECRIDAVHFLHDAPDDPSELQRFFAAPLHFGRPVNVIVFPCAYLERRLPEADPQLYAVIRRHADAVLEGLRAIQGTDLAAEVGRLVLESLSHGEPRVSDIAQALAMGERTLQRRLSELGTSFARIVEDTRHRLSLNYLEDPNLRLTEIAFFLGYSELSAFHRAFRRWSGTTPQQYRRTSG